MSQKKLVPAKSEWVRVVDATRQVGSMRLRKESNLQSSTPRSLVEKTYNVVHWSDMTSGGHFAALEQPELMLADLQAFITTVSGERP